MTHTRSLVGLALIAILVIAAAALAAAYYLKPIPAAQAAEELPPMDPAAPDTWIWRSCTILEIFVNESRAHVECTTAEPAGVWYYAMPADDDPAYVNRVLAILNTAYALGDPVLITYDTVTSHNPPGCLVSDCRALKQIRIR